MLRDVLRGALLVSLLVAAPAFAQGGDTPPPLPRLPYAPSNGPPAAVERTHGRLWPATLDVHAMIGVEPQGSRGNPIAFGVGAELLWKGIVGGFACLLSSEGTPILPHATGKKLPNGMAETEPSLGDRISVPFGLAVRPFATLGASQAPYVRKLLAGIDLQAGITVEHVRTSDDSATLAGLHLGWGVELPLYGGPIEGGVALRLYGRLIVTGDATLDTTISQPVFEGKVTGQFYGGIAFYP